MRHSRRAVLVLIIGLISSLFFTGVGNAHAKPLQQGSADVLLITLGASGSPSVGGVSAGTGTTYTGSAVAGTYTFIDSATYTSGGGINLGSTASCIATDNATGKTYFLSGSTNQIWIMNGQSFGGQIGITAATGGCAINSATSLLYYVENNTTLRVVNLATSTLSPTTIRCPAATPTLKIWRSATTASCTSPCSPLVRVPRWRSSMSPPTPLAPRSRWRAATRTTWP